MDPETTFRIALTAMLVITMSVTVYHRLQAARSGERISHRDEGYVFAALLRLAGVSFWIGVLLFLLFPHVATWARMDLAAWVRWCGVAIGVITPGLMLWTLHHLGKNLTDTVVTRAGATLVTSGPYRWVRHPFYLTAALFLTAAALISASWIVVVATAVILVMLTIRTPKEEQRLVERFGEDYRQYQERTGRFVPQNPYVTAALCVLVAFLVWRASAALIGNRINSSYFLVAIIVAGRLAGYGPSWLVLAAGTMVNIYGQSGQMGGFDLAALMIVCVHFVLGSIIVVVMHSERTARQRAEETSQQFSLKQRQLEQEVAQRRATEEDLRQGRQQTDLILQAGGLGIWTWDVGGNSVWWSRTNEAIHGYEPGEFSGTFDESIARMVPEDRQETQQRIEKLFSHDQMDPMTYRVRWPDGTIHWIEGRGQLFRDAAGRPLRVLGVCADVTERRRGEEALRASEERFRQLAMHSPVGITQADPEGRCTYANPYWCKLAGIPAEQALGDGWRVVVHPDDLERIMREWQESVQERRPYVSDCRLVKPSGEVVWVHFSTAAVCNADGSVRAYISTVADITERKAAEEALATKEAQLRSILDHTSAVIYLKDQAGRYLVVNRRMKDFVSREMEELVGKTDLEIFPETIARGLLVADAKVWHSRMPVECEEVAPIGGSMHTFRSIKFPVKDESGRMAALGGISTDITDLIEKQDLLRNLIHVQEEEKQVICYDFHDGLIQYAAGSLMLLESYKLDHLPGKDAPEIDMAIRSLKTGVTEGRRIIRGIRPTVLDDMGVIAAIDDLIDQLSNTGIKVEMDLDPGIGRLAPAIESTIYRVVQEALTNARKYSGSDRITIQLHQLGDDLELEIRDFGTGFDVESARKRGFGLLGMTERVRLLGGQCRIESKINHGTGVIARLPMQVAGDDKKAN